MYKNIIYDCKSESLSLRTLVRLSKSALEPSLCRRLYWNLLSLAAIHRMFILRTVCKKSISEVITLL